MSPQAIAQTLDHALLHPTLLPSEVASGCALISQLGVASVCVRPQDIALACRHTQGPTAVGTVIGFPHGSTGTSVKVYETQWSIEQGATELDLVIPIGYALEKDWAYVTQEIRAIRRASQGYILKVIFETDYLTDPLFQERLIHICVEEGADFIKSSTGFGFVKGPNGWETAGARPEDLARWALFPIQRKASGGIRTLEDALQFLSLGCTRLGTSSTVKILEEAYAQAGMNFTIPTLSSSQMGY